MTTTDPRAVRGTIENIDARAAARARGELADQLGLGFDDDDRQALTAAQLRSVPAYAPSLFDL